MEFKCDCMTHTLKIEDFDSNKFNKIKGLSIQIFDIYSDKGKKYKKPKLISDVVIMNNKYSKEYDKLVSYIKKHSEKK